VEEEQTRMVREFEAQIQSMGLNFPDYLTQMKKTEEEIKTEWKPQAKKRLAAHLILNMLADTEEIDVDTEEV